MKLIKSRSHVARNTVTVLAISLVYTQLHAAALSIPNVPVFLGTTVSPNVTFVLDNSGSMDWTNLPDAADAFASSWKSLSGEEIGGFNGKYGIYSTHCNGGYYNPSATYSPPVDSTGTPYPNSSYTTAWINGFNTGLGTADLSASNFWATGRTGSFYYQYSGTEPPRNFQYLSSGATDSNTFFLQCNSAVGSAPGNAVFTRVDLNSATAAVKQNYANWFSYYRTRIMAMKSGAGRAFAGLNDSYRVGFQTINNKSTYYLNTLPFTAANKSAWFNRFYGISPGGSTPLPDALRDVGEYYRTGVLPGVSGSVDPVIHSCQKNYTILSSDGYWNSSISGIGNRDLTVPTLPSPVTGLTTGASWPFPYREGTTAVSNTLADIATYYWVTDLRGGTGWDNNVPGDVSDPASWQHMTTYTLGFGLKGTLEYPTALPGLTAGTTRWPKPVSGSITAVDDLWHAGINGFGGYLSAQSPDELVTALQDTLSDVGARVTSSSSVAANTTSIQTGTRVYQARFDSGSWTGQLLSYTLSSAGAVSGTFEWDASAKLTAQTGTSSDSRVVLTRNGGGVPFQWGSLSGTQQNALRTPPSGGALDTVAVGQQRLEYLRGWSANEGNSTGQFRIRSSGKLGDIIDSNPWYVGQPQGGYSDEDHAGYSTFRSSYLTRQPIIYLGANDGMLHGFDASVNNATNLPTSTSGNEVLAYVPSRLYGKLSKLTGQTYNASHQYYVNSSPMVGDADFSAGVGTGWKTVLVNGLGQGGQAYFALNVTNPGNFSEANAASLVLWEFSDQDDPDLGYSFNQPTVNRLNGLSAQIVRMNNNKWAVVIGNGYNNTEADGNASTTGHGVLYILFLSNSFGGTWTLGTDYIKIDTGSGTLASPNGLATPLPVDTNGDEKVDVIYAGDLNGNMWKFDVSSASASSWGVANAGVPLFAASASKPITSAPQIVSHPNGGRMVLFGTGKFIETADASGPFTTQSLYGVWDNGAVVLPSSLVQQTITATVTGAGTEFRTVSANPVVYVAPGTAKGWYLNLTASTGETTPFNTLVYGGLALYSTLIPSANPCAFGGEGWLMALDPLTGKASSSGSFDADGDGSIGALESVTSGGSATTVSIAGRRSTVGIAPTPTILSVPSAGGGLYGGSGGGGVGVSSSSGMIYANGTGGLERFGLKDQPGSRGRIMWKEILR